MHSFPGCSIPAWVNLQVPPEVAALLWERSSGLPSFLEQLVVFLQLFVQTQLQSSTAAPEEDNSGRCVATRRAWA